MSFSQMREGHPKRSPHPTAVRELVRDEVRIRAQPEAGGHALRVTGAPLPPPTCGRLSRPPGVGACGQR